MHDYSISQLLNLNASLPLGSEEAVRYELRCRECHKSWGNVPKSICEECFSPLEVFFDYDSVRREFTKEKIAQGPTSIWRYSPLLPLPEGFQPTLPVGFTPTFQSPALAARSAQKTCSLRTTLFASRL